MNYFESILKITLLMSVMIAVLLLLSPIMRRAFTVKLHYYMWLFVALRMLFPFSPKFSSAIKIPLPPAAVYTADTQSWLWTRV